MSHITVGRWGRSLALRIPGDTASETGLREGERVEIAARDGNIVIRRAALRFAVEELFAAKSPQQWRETYADAYDWGPDLGREVVKE